MFARPVSMLAALACSAIALSSSAMSARAQGLFDFMHLNARNEDAPGAPRPPVFMFRRLLEDGYQLRRPLVLDGPVYFAQVTNQKSQPLCMVLDSYTGVILQTFAYTPHGLIALNHDAPGPGFPGYPPYPDAHFASACQGAPPVSTPLVRRPRPRPPVRVPLRIHKQKPAKRKIAPACGSYPRPLLKRSLVRKPKRILPHKKSGRICRRPSR